MMKISTKYLLKKALIWCWLAVFVGLLFAGGYYVLQKQGVSASDNAVSKQELTAATEDAHGDPQMMLYALYHLEYPGYSDAQSGGIGLSNYAYSVNDFFIGRLLCDSSYWYYYDRILSEYPALEPQMFTSDDMREMISIWQNGYEIVVRVEAPEIESREKSSFATQLGLVEDSEHYEMLSEEEKQKMDHEARCILRDFLFLTVNDYIEQNEIVDSKIAKPVRTIPAYEELMNEQSVISESAIASGMEDGFHISKKKLVLVFLLGAALAEGVVILLALFDGRIKDESDLIANSNLNVLQTVEAEDTWLEAALKLKLSKSWGKPLALVGVGIQEDELKASVQQLGEALKRVYGQEYPCTLAVNAVKNDLSWTLLLEDRPVVLVAEQMKTTYSNLQSAAESMQLVSNDICGIVLRKASRDKHRKG